MTKLKNILAAGMLSLAAIGCHPSNYKTLNGNFNGNRVQVQIAEEENRALMRKVNLGVLIGIDNGAGRFTYITRYGKKLDRKSTQDAAYTLEEAYDSIMAQNRQNRR